MTDRETVPRKPADKMRRAAEPRPLTATYLRNAAMHYLSSRAASREMVRQTLQRRALRRLAVKRLEEADVAMIEATLSQLVALGLINDKTFAESRTAGLVRKGLSSRRIGLGLRQKGLAAETIMSSLEAAAIDDLAQARVFAARKRLGPWRRDGARPETRDKDLRALARAGFSYTTAVKALAGDEE